MRNQKPHQRTLTQNKALHKLFELWANALNDAGKDMLVVLKDGVQIPWSRNTVEQYLWKPLVDQSDDIATANEAFLKALDGKIETDLLPTLQEVTAVKLSKGLRSYFGIVADALNGSGADMRVMLKSTAQVWWDKGTVKEFIWRPVQVAQLGKKSTTELTTKEIDIVYDTVNRYLGKHIDTVEFPSIEEGIIIQHYEKDFR